MRINKPKKSATALKYDGKNTPQLVAKGEGKLAEEIIEVAKQHNIHIHQDPMLLEVLSKLELGDEIPEQLYLAVAKIIAFAYFIQGKHPDYSRHTDTQTELIQLEQKTSSALENRSDD